ncbi:MAG TPA: DUF4411 domain-containing protein [Chlorobaculum sp.]|jgi:predicted nucleic acid-binding protein|uniref:PIN domain protein n=1 Tax=Chlorobaculum tepidum (strain ATCC 49652 / DSM 12025 / NBRC 103806 / TLS) TaxID=194439 RepID=Q8KAB2_CHLTE|nr:DUF4411 family protein [Chlorobaculum tepidum]AAM73469.1 conserved hypothetical protein [Chlorobaculum tepidum TLS]HBU24224.1 DUF4411 domain-containing protein [Chlorobaculum sp.]
MTYLLDANVFIQAKNLHYGLDFCPAFWEWLIESNASGKVFSIDKVAEEIATGADELTDWMHNHASDLFLNTDSGTVEKFGQVSTWATSQKYEPTAINTFLNAADFYLVAHALSGGYVLVTHEVSSNSQRKIKIPDACRGLQLQCMTPYEMLRREQARFILR